MIAENLALHGTLFGWSVSDPDVSIDENETDPGFAFDATVGKEWWVGGSWGLGLAGSFGYHSIPDDVVDSNWKGPSFGLRFSATLN